MNTQMQALRSLRTVTRNPAYLHPADMAERGLTSGMRVELVSGHGSVSAVVEADETVRPGVVSMTHGWGGLPDEADSPEEWGTNPQLLVSTVVDIDPINHMPRMSAIPVDIVVPENATG